MNKVLIVDDEISITVYLEKLLCNVGYDVIPSANNAISGIEKSKKLKPDVVIMDIGMPGKIDGIVAADIILQELKIPVIFLTGKDDSEIRKRAVSVFPASFLSKPIRISELVSNIDIAINNHKAGNFSKSVFAVCANCGNIRGDDGKWYRVDKFLEKSTGRKCSHGMCFNCINKLYHSN